MEKYIVLLFKKKKKKIGEEGEEAEEEEEEDNHHHCRGWHNTVKAPKNSKTLAIFKTKIVVPPYQTIFFLVLQLYEYSLSPEVTNPHCYSLCFRIHFLCL